MDRFQRESEDSLNASVDSSLIEAKFSAVLGIVGGIGTALSCISGRDRSYPAPSPSPAHGVRRLPGPLSLALVGAHPAGEPDRQVPRLRRTNYRAAGSRTLRKRSPRRRSRTHVRGPRSLRRRSLRLRGRGRGRSGRHRLRRRAREPGRARRPQRGRKDHGYEPRRPFVRPPKRPGARGRT